MGRLVLEHPVEDGPRGGVGGVLTHGGEEGHGEGLAEAEARPDGVDQAGEETLEVSRGTAPPEPPRATRQSWLRAA